MADVQLQISEVAKQVAVSIRTVRFYEERGLLTPSAYTSAGIRLYTAKAVNRLKFIRRLRVLGLTIEEIKRCFDSTSESGTRKIRVDQTLKLLNMQREKAQNELSKLTRLQEEIDVSIQKVKACSACHIKKCPEHCPSYGYIL